jgi:N-acetylglucosamine-6-phosphate deacetylase
VPIISAPALLIDSRLSGPGAVVVADGLIVDVLERVPAPGGDDIALPVGLLTPGLVDLQVNGAFGVDLAVAAPSEWDGVRQRLPATGVTSFVPTMITASVEDLVASAHRAQAAQERPSGEPGARILGVHLEGPFLSPDYAGAHDRRLIVDPAPQLVEALLAGPGLSIVTLAPERPDATAAIRRLAEAGVLVSIGHTAATAAEVRAAADAGARMVTHLFNAQRPLGHREPGVPGQALADERLAVGLIADLHHVAAPIVAVVFRSAPGRVALVTDATAALGMPPGRYRLGGQDVVLGPGGEPPRRDDGTVAGAALPLDAAVRNVVVCGVDPAAALAAATSVPARLLGREDVGRLAVGARADLVWWSDDLDVRRVWVAGTCVSV